MRATRLDTGVLACCAAVAALVATQLQPATSGTPPPSNGACSSSIDMVFVLDGSGSVGSSDFQSELTFARVRRALTQCLAAGATGVQTPPADSCWVAPPHQRQRDTTSVAFLSHAPSFASMMCLFWHVCVCV